MYQLNQEVAVRDGLLVATKALKEGVEVFVVYRLNSTQGLIHEEYSSWSAAFTLTKLNQMTRRG